MEIDDSKIEILLVEDNPGDAELAIRSLKKNKLSSKILHVEDGSQALNFLFAEGEFANRDIKNKPKIILLDLKMPKINGLEVLEKIKFDDRTKQIPVIVLTSSNEDPDIKRCYELGANSYIVKPVDYENYKKSVSELGIYWMFLNSSI